MMQKSLLAFVALCLASASAGNLPLVSCRTTKGPLLIEVHEDWAPLGARRFLDLVQDGFYTDIAFFRCVDRFLTQFGITDNPNLKHWHHENIPDDPNLNLGIRRNFVSYAGSGPNSRSTQIFIAFEDLDFLGNSPWETPFAEVIKGQQTLDNLFKGYGDIKGMGNGPDQQLIYQHGNAYLREDFPQIDYLESCELLRDEQQSNERQDEQQSNERQDEQQSNERQDEQQFDNQEQADNQVVEGQQQLQENLDRELSEEERRHQEEEQREYLEREEQYRREHPEANEENHQDHQHAQLSQEDILRRIEEERFRHERSLEEQERFRQQQEQGEQQQQESGEQQQLDQQQQDQRQQDEELRRRQAEEEDFQRRRQQDEEEESRRRQQQEQEEEENRRRQQQEQEEEDYRRRQAEEEENRRRQQQEEEFRRRQEEEEEYRRHQAEEQRRQAELEQQQQRDAEAARQAAAAVEAAANQVKETDASDAKPANILHDGIKILHDLIPESTNLRKDAAETDGSKVFGSTSTAFAELTREKRQKLLYTGIVFLVVVICLMLYCLGGGRSYGRSSKANKTK